MQLSLRLYLPKNPDEQVLIDIPLEFYALALDSDQSERLREILRRNSRINQDEIEDLEAGNVKLELIPRGVGRIEVQALNFYHEIRIGENVNMEVRVKNSGTRMLNNIRVYTDLPLNWRAEVKPDLIASLEQNKEEIIKIDFIPTSDVSVGDYESKIKIECVADNRRVESEDKTVRIHVSAKANVFGISLLALLLIGLLVGIVVFGIKLTRR